MEGGAPQATTTTADVAQFKKRLWDKKDQKKKTEYQKKIQSMKKQIDMKENEDVIKSYAEKSGSSIERVEKLWDKAKDVVKKEYSDVKEDSPDFYRRVNGVLKKMLKVESEINKRDKAFKFIEELKKYGSEEKI